MFEFYVILSIIFGFLTLLFAIFSIVCVIKEGAAKSTKLSAIATLFSAFFSVFSYMNITVPKPVILPLNNEINTYTDSLEVIIKLDKYNLLKTYYTLNGKDPEEGEVYKDTIVVSESTTVCARNKFLWMWSDISQSTYKFAEIPLIEEEPEEELSKTITLKANGKKVEVDRWTKIPINSNYPNISMETKMTSILHTHENDGNDGLSYIVSDQFVSSIDNPEGLYQEIIEEILRNPVYGDMIARGLVNDSNWFSDNNPWLNEFIEKTDEYFDIGINSEESTGMEKWLMALTDDPDTYYVNVEYRTYAEKICKLLDEFSIYGIYNFTIDGYWGLNIFPGSHSRTFFSQESETNLEAFILCKKATNGDIISILGFDLRDKGLLHYKHSTIEL